MKISMKGDYGLRALVDLAERYGEGPIQSKDIAERQYVPEPYLDQLLTVLRKAGFIQSRRGPQGGHSLARHPSTIRMSEIVAVLEGSMAPVGCLDGTVACALTGNCGQQEIWQMIEEASQKILEATSVSDLLQRQKARQQRAMYFI